MAEFRKNIDKIFSAEAFAVGGEFGASGELERGSRKVLLVLTGSPEDRRSFTYAMNVAQRIDAGLEIMFLAGWTPDSDTLDYFKDLLKQNEIEFHLTRVGGCMKSRILEYTSKRSNIQFVVAESLDALNNECQQEDRSLRGALKNLRCPLVLVSEMDRT